MPSSAAVTGGIGAEARDATVLELSRSDAVEAWSLRAGSSRGAWDPFDPTFVPRFDWRSAVMGETARASLAFDWRRQAGAGWISADANARLARTSLADGAGPIGSVEQRMRDSAFGAALRWNAGANSLRATFRGRARDVDAGTRDPRGELDLFREDRLDESDFGIAASTVIALPLGIRAEVGTRYDWYRAGVRSDVASRAGETTASGLSSRVRLSARAPFVGEAFVKLERGGEPAAMSDPRNGAPVARIDPALRRDTIEIGFNRRLPLGIETTVSMFRAKSDEEILLTGENAITEFARPTLRQGVQAAARYEPAKWLAFDFRAQALHARYADGAGEYVPGAAERNASVTATMLLPGHSSAGLTVNYLGKRAGSDAVVPLRDSTFVNARFTRELTRDTHVALDLLNVFDQKLRDVDYFSASRLPDNGAEPRGLRLRLRTTF